MSWLTEKNIKRYEVMLLTEAAGPRRDTVVNLLKRERRLQDIERAADG